MQINGTVRELAGRIAAFKARTGRDLAAIWISPQRFAMLPEALRAQIGHSRRPGFTLDGIPVRVIEILPPEGRRG